MARREFNQIRRIQGISRFSAGRSPIKCFYSPKSDKFRDIWGKKYSCPPNLCFWECFLLDLKRQLVRIKRDPCVEGRNKRRFAACGGMIFGSMAGKPAQQPAWAGWWQSFINTGFRQMGERQRQRVALSSPKSFLCRRMWSEVEIAVFLRFFGTGSCRGMNISSRKEDVLTAGQTAKWVSVSAQKKRVFGFKYR